MNENRLKAEGVYVRKAYGYIIDGRVKKRNSFDLKKTVFLIKIKLIKEMSLSGITGCHFISFMSTIIVTRVQ